MALGDRVYDQASDKQWGSEVYRKAKEVIEETLSAASGTVQFASICEAMKRGYPKLCNDQIKAPWDKKLPYWKDRVSMALQQIKKEGKVLRADNGWIWAGVKTSPAPIAAPKRHDELKQKMVDIGLKLGYNTSTEEGPEYRHDVLWRTTPYRTPSHVVEVCEGGVLAKDFASLIWARENWNASGILIVTNDRDFEKANRQLSGQTQITIVKAETVDKLHELIMTDLEFLKSIFSG